jgi:hypothetical protein
MGNFGRRVSVFKSAYKGNEKVPYSLYKAYEEAPYRSAYINKNAKETFYETFHKIFFIWHRNTTPLDNRPHKLFLRGRPSLSELTQNRSFASAVIPVFGYDRRPKACYRFSR